MANKITEVRLLAVPLENDYMHTLYFDDKGSQTNYFLSKTVSYKTDFSYQRKDSVIRWPVNVDNLYNCNYVMYRNTAYSSKWFYAFITKMEYVNDDLTDITIETDVIQTWLFDYEVKESFVEREHVSDDTPGLHTVPEQLETGDYIINKYSKCGYCGSDDLKIVLGVTRTPEKENANGLFINGIYSGIKYYKFPNTEEGGAGLNEFIKDYADKGQVDAIVCMFLAPQKLVGSTATSAGDDVVSDIDTKSFYINDYLSDETNSKAIEFSDNKLNGYTPQNKKLLSYPYRYLLASNNAGGNAVYKYELFNGTPKFVINGCTTPGCSIRMLPKYYNGGASKGNENEALPLGKFPILNWVSDVYTNWLTQNATNLAINAGMAVAGMALAPATGGMSLAGVSPILHTASEIYQHSMVPPQAEGNLNSGDVITAEGENDFHFYDMTIKREYAEIIDGFFNMYGYKVNRVKVPNKNHRQNYWYTKCIHANIDGAIPIDDLQKIKECYDNGITFWKNPAYIQNFFIENPTI